MFSVEMRTEPPTLDPLDLPEGTEFFEMDGVPVALVGGKNPPLRFDRVPPEGAGSAFLSEAVGIERKLFVALVKAVSAAP